MTRIVTFLFGGFGLRRRVDPKFHPDMSKSLGISKPAVAHHYPQCGELARSPAYNSFRLR
jgi:hypothetical protein